MKLIHIGAILSALLLTACANEWGAPKDGVSLVDAVTPASAAQCPTGGYIVSIYQDNAKTGSYVEGDTPVNNFTICDGLTGVAGSNGTNGTNGSNGSNGTNGTNGSDGTSCTVAPVPPNNIAPNGGAEISCSDGSASLVLNGTNGTDGTDGTNGTNGSNGINGTNGTVITAVQFCPGTGSYPSEFPEVGFCMNGNIYAVYSANGGFLTEVLPGTWSSDGIGNSCTFTVGPNCTITNN